MKASLVILILLLSTTLAGCSSNYEGQISEAAQIDELNTQIGDLQNALQEANNNIDEANDRIDSAKYNIDGTYEDMNDALNNLDTVDNVPEP
jgi:peptidoglycan hydrolase CwlO-like protein